MYVFVYNQNNFSILLRHVLIIKQFTLDFDTFLYFYFICVSGFLADEKDVGDSSVKEDIVNDEKPRIAHPLHVNEGTDDDFVSVSISVVRDDDPVPVVPEPEDKDVVTVTRIPQGSSEEKPVQDPVNGVHKSDVSIAEDVGHSKVIASENQKKLTKVTTIPDTLQVIPVKLNSDTCESQGDHTVKMDGFLGFPVSPEKEVSGTSPENMSSLNSPSDKSKECFEFSDIQEKSKSIGNKKKADSEGTVLKEPEKSLMKSLDVNDAVPNSCEKQSDSDEGIDARGSGPNLGGVCYTVIPSPRKRISISVDSKMIRTSTSLGVRTIANLQDTNSVLQNLKTFKLKQQMLGSGLSKNFTLTSNENNTEGCPPKTLRVYGLSRNVQKNSVKFVNIAERDVAIKNPVSNSPMQLSMSENPSVTEMNSLSIPSLKGNILQGKGSDFKYVVYDNSKCRLVPASLPSGNKVGYHILTSGQLGRNGNAMACSNSALKTEMVQKGTTTPVYVAIVSSASANAAGTTNSITGSAVKSIMAVVGSSNQRTRQIGPQVGNNVHFLGHSYRALYFQHNGNVMIQYIQYDTGLTLETVHSGDIQCFSI
jgi:hypothetical protein